MNKVLSVALVILMTACGYDNDTLTEVTVEAPELCKPGHKKDAGIEIEDAGVTDECL